jgi:hypothetical protein
MTDLPGPEFESRYGEALIEKVAEAIRQSAVVKMEEGEDLALYVANIWRTYARAALATIEAEQQAEIAALVEAAQQASKTMGFDDGGPYFNAYRRLRDALEPFERTLGSTRNETER